MCCVIVYTMGVCAKAINPCKYEQQVALLSAETRHGGIEIKLFAASGHTARPFHAAREAKAQA